MPRHVPALCVWLGFGCGLAIGPCRSKTSSPHVTLPAGRQDRRGRWCSRRGGCREREGPAVREMAVRLPPMASFPLARAALTSSCPVMTVCWRTHEPPGLHPFVPAEGSVRLRSGDGAIAATRRSPRDADQREQGDGQREAVPEKCLPRESSRRRPATAGHRSATGQASPGQLEGIGPVQLGAYSTA